jgi:hypothetical protein
MKLYQLSFLIIFFTHTVFGQGVNINDFSVIDKKALEIPEPMTKSTDQIASYINKNFSSENEKVRAVFIWVSSNIQYDVQNMYAVNLTETKEDKISKPLRTRKGICENYAALFADLCSKVGIKSYIIEGYTKQNGVLDALPHAWNAAWINGSWFLFDPTWASGYVKDGKFFPKINNDFYQVHPSVITKSHMPFDYLWQFLEYPLTNQEFLAGKTVEDTSKPHFNYREALQAYENQSRIEQVTAYANRIEENGVNNALIFERLKHLKLEIENDKRNRTVNAFNEAVYDFNDGIKNMNDFINFRNKQFTPEKPDAEIQSMIDAAATLIETAKNKVNGISNPDPNTAQLIQQLAASITDASAKVKEQQDWLSQYLSKNKTIRKTMFYKVTVAGKAINE